MGASERNNRSKGLAKRTDEVGFGTRGCLATAATVPGIPSLFYRHKFHVAISLRWKHKGHINVLELEALLPSVRHARRSPVSAARRVQFGLDSTVALGVARKGRSSRPNLNWVARKLCAQFILGGIYPGFFWIPTKYMPADEPSRRLCHRRSCVGNSFVESRLPRSEAGERKYFGSLPRRHQ